MSHVQYVTLALKSLSLLSLFKGCTRVLREH